MLETIREYGLEQLQRTGELPAVSRRHATFYLALAEEAADVIGPDHKDADAWVARLDADHDNLRAALDRILEAGDGGHAQQLAGALWKFWYMRGYIGEGRRWLAAALAFATPRTAIRARALNGGTSMSLESGDVETGRRWAEEALAINRELGDDFGIAHAEFLLANVEAGAGNWSGARQLLEPARERFGELNSSHYTLLSTRVLVWVLRELGDHETAQSLSEENLRDARAAGNKRVEAMMLGSLAYAAIDERRLADAAPLVRDSYRLKREQGDQISVASDLFTIARLLAYSGRPEAATRVLARSAALHEELGAAIPSYDIPDREAAIAHIRETLTPDEYAAAWSAGRALTDGDVDVLLDELLAAAAE
jgi:ATP/maltotriose-dependent transcriptional regulator MalT